MTPDQTALLSPAARRMLVIERRVRMGPMVAYDLGRLLGVSRAQIMRDLAHLRRLGARIVYDRVHGGYRFTAPWGGVLAALARA